MMCMRQPTRIGTVLLAVTLLIGFGCREQPPTALTNRTTTPMIPKASDRQLIRQAVLLSLMEGLSTDRKLQPVFFVVLEPGEDQSLAVAYKGLKVRNAKDCVVDQVQGVKDKRTGEPGLLLEVKQLTIRGDEADVFAGYFSGAGVLFSFRLQKKEAVWIILEKKQRVISG